MHFYITWVISQQFSHRNFKPVTFLVSASVFGWTGNRFSTNSLSFVSQKLCDSDPTWFLGHTSKYFVIYLLLLEMCVTYDTPFTLEKLVMAEFGEHIQLTLHNSTSYNSNLSVILTNFLAQWKFPNKSS